MPNITLPDGKQLSFSESVTGFQLAEKISKSLSKQALVISVDGNYCAGKSLLIKILKSIFKENVDIVVLEDIDYISSEFIQND